MSLVRSMRSAAEVGLAFSQEDVLDGHHEEGVCRFGAIDYRWLRPSREEWV